MNERTAAGKRTKQSRAASSSARQPAERDGGEFSVVDTEHLLNCIAAGVVRVSSEGIVTYANAQALRISTGHAIVGRSLREFESFTVFQDERPCTYDDYPPIKCLRTGEVQSGVTIGVRQADQRINWVTVTAVPLFDPKTGKPESALATFVDSSHPVHVEESLRQSEDRYRRLLELAPDAIVVHRGGPIVYINNAGVQLWGGRSAEDFIGRNVMDFVHPKYRDAAQARIDRAMGGEASTLMVQRNVRLDGKVVPVEVAGTPCVYEGQRSIQVIFRDVSRRLRTARALRRAKAELEQRVDERTDELSRKNAELQRKQKFMQRALKRHERDRQLVAYEIHDTILQDVIGALMFVDAALDGPGGPQADDRKSLETARGLLRKCIDGSRRMISGLRPPIIDEQGVRGSIEYLVNELRSRGLEVRFAHEMQAERLPGELETTIFRIVQEALTNVERHAESARAEVSITERDGVIRIEVRDRGVGFDPEAVVDGHFGLEGIRERARLSGGSAAIESAPGKGTTVTVELPIAAEDALRSKT